MDFNQKTVIVTGAGGAIGSALAKSFAEDKANVVVNYRKSKASAESVVKDIKDSGGNAIAVQCDISIVDDIKRMMQTAKSEFGSVDVMINNATVGPQIPLLELTEDDFEDILKNNVRGYWYCSTFAAKEMVKQGTGGYIVNISSISSRSVTSSYVHYAAGKGAIEAMTRGMAVALAENKINVNCVAPGVVMTPTVKNMFEDPKNADPVIDRTPGNEITEIEDCVGIIKFLCTPESRMIRGQVIDVDGGYSIHGMEWQMSEEMKDFRKNIENKGYNK